MRIPPGATVEIQQAFRDLWSVIDTLTNGNTDLQGRRIINAGDAKADADYVTRRQLKSSSASLDPLVVDNATVRKALLIENLLRFRTAVLSNPAAGTVQLTKGDGTTFGSFKLLTLLLSGHARLTSTADDVVDLLDHGTGATYATIKALKFQPVPRQTYTPSAVTTLRAGDFSALSTDDVRSILGTLITDLQAAGLLA